MTSKKTSSKKPTRTKGAVPGVEVLPYGLEGAAMFNQWVEHLIRAIYIVHPGLGDWWTNDEYKALKAYNHRVEVPPVGFNDDGVAIPMAPTEAAAYRKRERDGRVDKKNKDIDKREEDLPTVYSKLLCLLTPEGIDQVKNLPEWVGIAAAKDPIMLKHAIIKTHSTAMLAGTAQQSKYRSFQDYVACKMLNEQTIHQFICKLFIYK